MKFPQRFALFFIGMLFVVCFTTSSFGQSSTTDDSAAMGALSPGYVRATPVGFSRTAPVQLFNPSTILDFPGGDAATSRAIFAFGTGNNGAGGDGASGSNAAGTDTDAHHPGGNITGLDTVPTFAGAFAAMGGPSQGVVFPFIMMGNHPLVGGTTTIPAKMNAISLQLLNPDGSVNINVPFGPFENLTEDSPNFEEANYRSGQHIQFGDAVQRAEFFNSMEENWHTELSPRFVDRVTIQIPRFVNVRLQNGTIVTVQAYFVGTAPDGNKFVLLLDLLFNFLNFNQVVNEINAGNFTTDAFNMNLYPNTFLFSLNTKGQPDGCCVLGFHTFFFEPGVVSQPRWIFAFSSWISPGIFSGGFADVTGLSHETSEAFNDPFVNTRVPTWQFPGVPANAKVCQSNLETGDPVEVLSAATVPITIRERKEVFTYHPQTEALLQWFEMGATSDAIDGAFSFPNEAALPHSALPCPQ